MKRQDGIVIVSSLVLMMAVLGLAVGSLFLTQSNLQVAYNMQSNAVAKYAAEAGMDATLVALDNHFTENQEYPDFSSGTVNNFNLPTVTVSGQAVNYAVQEFSISGDSAVLKVEASLANGASYVSEALLAATIMSTSSISSSERKQLVANGLVSEGTVGINGRSNFVSAAIHGNSGFTLNGFNNMSFFVCEARNSTGSCTSRVEVEVEDLPVSAAAGMSSYTCNPANSSICQDGIPTTLSDTVTVAPEFASLVSKAISGADVGSSGTYSSIFDINCDVVHQNAPSMNNSNSVASNGFVSGNVVCVHNGNVTFPNNTDLDDVTIIARNTIQFNGNSLITLKDSLLVSTNQSLNVSKTIIDGTSIFTKSNINLNGQQNKFKGIATLASAGDITIKGGSTIVPLDGEIGIGLGLISERNITVNGNSDWYAVGLAGGTFIKNGTSTMIGGVSSKGNIQINGGIDIDSGLNIFNDDFFEEVTSTEETTTQRLTEYSRR